MPAGLSFLIEILQASKEPSLLDPAVGLHSVHTESVLGVKGNRKDTQLPPKPCVLCGTQLSKNSSCRDGFPKHCSEVIQS